MKINKFVLLILIFITSLQAHKVAGIKLNIKDLKDNTILITAQYKKSKRALVGNKVKLISMIDNRVLFEDKLPQDGLIAKIPDESYWVYLIVRDTDVVLEGPSPLEGFKVYVKKEPKAFLYTFSASMIFLGLSAFLIFRKKSKRKES